MKRRGMASSIEGDETDKALKVMSTLGGREGCIYDDSDADSCDDIDEVREKYNKLHVFSKKLIEASEKLSNKIKKLENTLSECTQERDERNKEIELLLEKNKALAASTKSKDKSKDDIQIGTKVLDHILSIQRRPNDRSGLGYHATPSNPPIGRNGTKDKKTNANYMQNMISPPTTKKQMTAEDTSPLP
ncbi:hypothetical protein RHGRI_014014 [Rhododendron griersonianum]|uniref:Uncharacterized protein n=1 Tax=Rhododendron griersonianum TaxID=479676 RepID=A0AAV6K7T5_9ERIC|nr:hypothetical protein RHGRI_014014 [Rhododendron griersonianum]